MLVRFKATKTPEASALPGDHDSGRGHLVDGERQTDFLRVEIVVGKNSLRIPAHLFHKFRDLPQQAYERVGNLGGVNQSGPPLWSWR